MVCEHCHKEQEYREILQVVRTAAGKSESLG